MARARLTIDLAAIAANWRALDALTGPETATAAVVKADAYGLGIAAVGPALVGAGARDFFVALTEEGRALRDAIGPGPRIHILSGLMPGDAPLCRAHDLVPCLNSRAQLDDFLENMRGFPCAVQIDSGMHRLGFSAAELAESHELITAAAPALILSHLACADTPDNPRNAAQLRAFTELSASLPAARRSLSATGGLLLGPPYAFDLTRPGIGLFGGLPFADARPVVTLSLPVIQTRAAAPGAAIGYSAGWIAEKPSKIATISGGYADGLLRALGNGGVQLYAGDIPCPLIGRVSMDLITVDVTHLDQVPDHLDILNAHQGVDDLAAVAGTIGYEILTGLGDRYERVYKDAA